MTDSVPPEVPDAPQPPAKKRPRLDLAVGPPGVGRERKRGKSMFGLVVGTLTKAKIEDKERSASEAAKKRHLIEQRLQTKLRNETDSVRRAEEAKKDKMAANRKEEELQLKDSLYKFRRTRLPLYANFLLTSDVFPSDDQDDTPHAPALANPARTHPPPLYYLPAILLPAQAAFLARRKRQVTTASEAEYTLFRDERARGIVDVNALRQRVADEEARKRSDAAPADADPDAVADPDADADADPDADADGELDADADTMDVDPARDREREPEAEKKDDAPLADEVDAVEY